MTAIGTLAEAVLRLSVDGAKLVSGLNEAEAKSKASVERLKKTLDGVRNVAAVAFGVGIAALKSFGDAAKEKEGQIARYTAQMEILGGVFKTNKQLTIDWASEMEKLHDFDSDDILEQFQKAGSATKDYGQSVMLLETAMDLANLKGKDVEQTTQALTMAYVGNVRGLRTMGIFLEQGVKGHEALKLVQAQVAGGSAKTADTVERAERRMQIAWENSREKLGKDLQPMLIKIYGTLSTLAGQLENVDGKTLAWTVGVSGLVMIAAQAWKWIIELRGAMALYSLTTGVAAGKNAAFAGSLRAIHPAALIAVAAIGLITAAYTRAAQAAERYRKSTGDDKTLIRTDKGLQTSKEIFAEDAPTNAQLWWADVAWYMGLAKPGEARPSTVSNERSQRAEETQLQVDRLQQQNAELREYRRRRENAKYRPNQGVNQQLANIMR